AAVTLRKDVVSPLSPRNDDEGEKEKKDKDKNKDKDKDKDKDKEKKKPEEGRKKDEPKLDDDKDKSESKKDETKDEDKKDKKSDEKDEKKEDKPPKPVEIDLADFERRSVILPPKPGYFADLAAVNGKLIYRRLPRAGSADEKSALVFYDLEKREDKTILED